MDDLSSKGKTEEEGELSVCALVRGGDGRGQTGENGAEEEIWKQKAGSEIVPEQRTVAIAASYKMHMASSIS